jgi:hypothetical protein
MPYDPLMLWEWEGGALGPEAQSMPDSPVGSTTPSASSRSRAADEVSADLGHRAVALERHPQRTIRQPAG